MPNPQLNVHKSTAAMNYFFSNITNTVIFMTLGDLRIHHTTAVPFSPLHVKNRRQQRQSAFMMHRRLYFIDSFAFLLYEFLKLTVINTFNIIYLQRHVLHTCQIGCLRRQNFTWEVAESGKTPDECVFIAYLCMHVNKVI